MILDSAVKELQGEVAGELQQAFQEATVCGQWLVLVENEPTVIRRLRETLGEEAHLLPIDWRDSESMLEAIKTVIGERSRIARGGQLALVGSSRGGLGCGEGLSNRADEEPAVETTGREFERWVAGANRMQYRLQHSKRQFAGAVQALVEKLQDELSPAALEGKLHTLFYHAEAGLFLEYDWRQWQFRPVN